MDSAPARGGSEITGGWLPFERLGLIFLAITTPLLQCLLEPVYPPFRQWLKAVPVGGVNLAMEPNVQINSTLTLTARIDPDG